MTGPVDLDGRLKTLALEIQNIRTLDDFGKATPSDLVRLGKLETEAVQIQTAIAARDASTAQRMLAEANTALATAQLDAARVQAAATERLAAAQREVAESQLKMASAQAEQTARREVDRMRADDADFWFRRMITSTSVANAAGLASTLAIAGSGDFNRYGMSGLSQAATLYLGGVVMGGLAPCILWAQRKGYVTVFRRPVSLCLQILVLASAFCFTWGGSELVGVLMGERG